MSEPYRASEFLADFTAAIQAVRTVPDLEARWRFYQTAALEHGVRNMCVDICRLRKLELSQPGDGGGAAA